MLSPNDLIEVYKIAAMAAVFTSEDFRKSVDAHVKRFEQIEAQHKINLARQSELQVHALDVQRAALQDERDALKVAQQTQQEIQEKWEREKQKIQDKHTALTSNLSQRAQELQVREMQVATQATDLSKRQSEMLAKEAQLRDAAAALAQERREMQLKLGKLKDLVRS